MRIRKHSQSSLPSSSSHTCEALLTHVCQLNRSPWDAMTFSPRESFHFQLGMTDGAEADCPPIKEEVVELEEEEQKPAAAAAIRVKKCRVEAKAAAHSRESDGCEAATRARRSRAPSSSNFYYYYSGFGPMWRRRRGRVQHQEIKQEMDGPDHSTITHSSPSSSSSVVIHNDHDDDDIDDDDDDDDDGSGFKRPVKVRSLKSLL